MVCNKHFIAELIEAKNFNIEIQQQKFHQTTENIEFI
jgi:hypothetical protein